MPPDQSADLAVIFDLDGLLADTEPLWTESARRILGRRGHEFDLNLKPTFMGRHPLEVTRRMVEHYHLSDTPEELLRERLAELRAIYEQEQIRPRPGVRELVAALAVERVPMCVASGSPGDLVAIVLRRLDLSRAFQHAIGSDAVAHGKPAPDLFLLAAARLGAAPRRCVVLEDSPAGVEAALAAGMTCVAVPGPEVPLAAVQRAHHIARSLIEVRPSLLRALADQHGRPGGS
jgi:HAD superfamily hydrolase (TIGR01509 family)